MNKLAHVKQPNKPRFFCQDDLIDAGVTLQPGAIRKVVEDALLGAKAGVAYGGKASLTIPEAEMNGFVDFMRHGADFEEERLGWKLSSLYSVNDRYGAVKIIGANAFNRRIGLPRSTSTIILLDKFTMRPLCLLDGTQISSMRTGAYASIVADLFMHTREDWNVFLFGTGTIAESILLNLAQSHQARIGRVHVKGRCAQSADRFVRAVAPRTHLPLTPVLDNEALSHCQLVISATNARQPLYRNGEIRDPTVSLHLGGDETPVERLRHVLRRGHVFCDDVKTVASRNSQSLALLFSRQGVDLASVAPALGIRNLYDVLCEQAPPAEEPVHATCVGLPMLDLYAASYVYETFLQ